jgi:hypothetical protein
LKQCEIGENADLAASISAPWHALEWNWAGTAVRKQIGHSKTPCLAIAFLKLTNGSRANTKTIKNPGAVFKI